MTVNIEEVLEMVESSHRKLSENLAILRGQTLALQRKRVLKARLSNLQCQVAAKSGLRKRPSCKGSISHQKYKILSKERAIQAALSRINIEYYSSTSSSCSPPSDSLDGSEAKRGTLRVGRRRQEYNDKRGGQPNGCNNGSGESQPRRVKPHLHLRYYVACGHQVSFAAVPSTDEDSFGMCVCDMPPRYDTFRFRSGGGMENHHQQMPQVLQLQTENNSNIHREGFQGMTGTAAGGEVRYRQNREEHDGFCESCHTAA